MSSNINALLDKAEDPEKMIDQCLRNLQSDLAKVKAETASVMAEEQRAKRALNECKEEMEKMQTYAIKALEANNEQDARKFLEKKSSLADKQSSLNDAYMLANNNATQMRQMHDKLVKDVNELESKKNAIKSKLAIAKTQERLNKIGSSVTSANNSMTAFSKYEEQANQALDQANAIAQLNKPFDDIADLTAKYSSNSSEIDDELAALKNSLNK